MKSAFFCVCSTKLVISSIATEAFTFAGTAFAHTLGWPCPSHSHIDSNMAREKPQYPPQGKRRVQSRVFDQLDLDPDLCRRRGQDLRVPGHCHVVECAQCRDHDLLDGDCVRAVAKATQLWFPRTGDLHHHQGPDWPSRPGAVPGLELLRRVVSQCVSG